MCAAPHRSHLGRSRREGGGEGTWPSQETSIYFSGSLPLSPPSSLSSSHGAGGRAGVLGDEMTAAVRRLAISLSRSPEEQGREREVITIIRATCGVMTSLLSPRGGWTDPTSTYPVHSLLRAFSRVWTLSYVMLSPPAGISPNLWAESLNHSASSFPPSSASR